MPWTLGSSIWNVLNRPSLLQYLKRIVMNYLNEMILIYDKEELFFETMFLWININSVRLLSTYPDLLRYSFFSSVFLLLIDFKPVSISKFKRGYDISLYDCSDKDLWLKYKNYRELSLSVFEQSASFFPFLLSYYFSLPVSLRSAGKSKGLSQSPRIRHKFNILVLSRKPVRKM